VSVFHDTNLPVSQWTSEVANITPADINFTATVIAAKRLSASVIVSRSLLIQFAGSESLDQFIASRLKVAFASVIDQSCLYGSGAANNQPVGVITATGSQNITVTNPPFWSDLTGLRYAATNYNADLSSFGRITNHKGRKYFESTPRFTNAAASMWDLMQREAEISLEVNDDRIFAGLWNYLLIGFWSGTDIDGPAVDLTVDPFFRAEYGETIITGDIFVDVAVRWPQLFAFSQASIFP
jgi:hypothetical protein